MKKLLVASTALVIAAPAFASEVTLSGTFDADFTTGDATIGSSSTYVGTSSGTYTNATVILGTSLTTYSLLENGDGDINTLTLGINVKGDGHGATLTLSPLNSGGIVGGYNVYADTVIGTFSIGTNSGITTDEDMAETGAAVDTTFKGKDDLTDFWNYGVGVAMGGDFGVDDGPVDDIAGAANSVSGPSLSYKSPDLGGLSFGITWGSRAQGSATTGEDYVINLGYSSDLFTAAVDYNGAGDYRLDLKVATGFGNFLIEYGFGASLPAGSTTATALVTDNDNFELRFETQIGEIAGAIYYNSDDTIALEGKYDAGMFSIGASYTMFGDDAAIKAPTATGATTQTWATAGSALLGGGVTAYGIELGTDALGMPMTLTYKDIDAGLFSGDSLELAVQVNDYVTVTLNDDSQLNIAVSASF